MSISARDWIAHHARYAPAREASVDLHSGRRFNYGQMDERVTRAALFLRDGLGVGDGDRVAVLCHNDTDVFEIQFACRRLGAMLLPLNWRLTVPELEYICNDATPAALLYGAEFADKASDLASRCKLGATADMANGESSGYETGLASASGTLGPAPERTLDDTWTVMYTSGTTGRPKGARITYGMCFFNGVHASMTTDLTSRSTNLAILPTFHTGGLNVFANPVYHAGGCNVVMRNFEPAGFLALLADRDLRVTHCIGVPTNFLMLAQEPGFADADFSHVECLYVGGAASSLSLLETYAAKGVALRQGWGMTEVGPMGLALAGEVALEKVGSCGLPLMHTEIRVADESGNDVLQGDVGELLARGPTVTPGYWANPEANAVAFTGDGWFRTGDAARQDEDGYFYIVDRRKDMYISGGENVYPAEIENAIYALDTVLETAVVGVPDDKWGHVGRAFVVAKPGQTLNESMVVTHCKARLATFKVPKQVRVVDELPHNATGKILKHQLPRD